MDRDFAHRTREYEANRFLDYVYSERPLTQEAAHHLKQRFLSESRGGVTYHRNPDVQEIRVFGSPDPVAAVDTFGNVSRVIGGNCPWVPFDPDLADIGMIEPEFVEETRERIQYEEIVGYRCRTCGSDILTAKVVDEEGFTHICEMEVKTKLLNPPIKYKETKQVLKWRKVA